MQNFQMRKHGNQKRERVNTVGTLATLFPPAKESGSVPCNQQAVGNESVAQERRKVLENSELQRINEINVERERERRIRVKSS